MQHWHFLKVIAQSRLVGFWIVQYDSLSEFKCLNRSLHAEWFCMLLYSISLRTLIHSSLADTRQKFPFRWVNELRWVDTQVKDQTHRLRTTGNAGLIMTKAVDIFPLYIIVIKKWIAKYCFIELDWVLHQESRFGQDCHIYNDTVENGDQIGWTVLMPIFW